MRQWPAEVRTLIFLFLYILTQGDAITGYPYCQTLEFLIDPKFEATKATGVYTLQPQIINGRPLYRNTDKDLYVYFINYPVDSWVIGIDVGDSTGYGVMYSNSITPYTTSKEWHLWSNDLKTMVKDVRAKFVCPEAVCKMLQVFVEGVPSANGIYEPTNATGGGVIYQESNTKTYIFKHSLPSGCSSTWILGPVLDPNYQGYIYSSSDTISPDWVVSDWNLAPSNILINITIQCIDDVTRKPLTQPTHPPQVTTHPPQVTTHPPQVTTHQPQDVHQDLILTSFPEECGIRKIQPPLASPYIVAGRDATYRGKWPWMVAILNEKGKLKCGGVLLSTKVILTAAHCLKESYPVEEYSVVLGAHDLDRVEDGQQWLGIEQVVRHPNYTLQQEPFRLVYDIALVKLNSSVNYTGYVQPICLPEMGSSQLPFFDSDNRSSFTDCHILGWGYRFITGNSGGILQEQDTGFSTVAYCAERFFSMYSSWLVTSDSFCAYPHHSAKVCDGDSGSPVLCQQEDHWTVLGVASWSVTPCLASNIPSVYVEVSKVLPWIAEVTGQDIT